MIHVLLLRAINMGKEDCKNVRVAKLNHHFSAQTKQINKHFLSNVYKQMNKQNLVLFLFTLNVNVQIYIHFTI